MAPRWKYPRTPHLTRSPGVTDDDRVSRHEDSLLTLSRVIVTEKLDGECTTIYSDGTHARSIDSRHHASRNLIKSLQAQIGYRLGENMRVCGENVYARHSLAYTDLTNHFYAFSIWIGDRCLCWDTTVEIASDLGLSVVPVIHDGEPRPDYETWHGPSSFGTESEGFVIRDAGAFRYDDFGKRVAKYVRANHVQTDRHWLQNWSPNGFVRRDDDEL